MRIPRNNFLFKFNVSYYLIVPIFFFFVMKNSVHLFDKVFLFIRNEVICFKISKLIRAPFQQSLLFFSEVFAHVLSLVMSTKRCECFFQNQQTLEKDVNRSHFCCFKKNRSSSFSSQIRNSEQNNIKKLPYTSL